MQFTKFFTHFPPERRYFLPILLLLAVGLFPVGWLAPHWPLLNWLLHGILASEYVHVAGHFLLFMLVGAAVCRLFPSLRFTLVRYLLLILLLGALQEWLQLRTFKHSGITPDEFLDLTVDMLGGLTFWFTARRGGV
jgi:hypothetical protein